MAIVKVKEARGMSKSDITKRLGELRLDLAKANAQIKIGSSPENPGRVGELKRTIARLLTIQREGGREK